MKTDGSLHGSYFDLLEAKHPDLGPAPAKVRRPSRPRPVRRRRRTGSLLVVATGVLAGVAWLAVALKPEKNLGSTEMAALPAIEAHEDLEAARGPSAVIEEEAPPAPAAVDLAVRQSQSPSPRPEPAAPRPSPARPVPEPVAARPLPAPPGPDVSTSRPLPIEAAPVPASGRRESGVPVPQPESIPTAAPASAAPPAALLPARAISSSPPEYPEAARLAAEEGTVVVEAEVDAAGVVRSTTVVRGMSPALDRAAADALGRWRFEPATQGGVAVASTHRVGFKFALQPAGEDVDEEPSIPLEVGGEVQPPRRLTAPLPVYPDAAWAAGVTGDVLVRAVIDEGGEVTGVEVLRGLPYGMTEAAVEAIQRWKFAPATRRGQPVAVYRNLSVRFGT